MVTRLNQTAGRTSERVPYCAVISSASNTKVLANKEKVEDPSSTLITIIDRGQRIEINEGGVRLPSLLLLLCNGLLVCRDKQAGYDGVLLVDALIQLQKES